MHSASTCKCLTSHHKPRRCYLRRVTVHFLRVVRAERAAAEAQATPTMAVVIIHAKERVAELTAVEAIVPGGRLSRQVCVPARAREVHGPLVIEVQRLERVLGVRRLKVDLDSVHGVPSTVPMQRSLRSSNARTYAAL